MATRGSSRKKTSGRKPTTKTTRRTSSRKKQTPSLSLSLRPEHQRELIALAMITLALITLIFFFTGKTGGIGSVYMLGVHQAFGAGALIVPLSLGILGMAILLQERMHSAEITFTNGVGVIFTLSMVLTFLEFPAHNVEFFARSDEGGGMIGYTLVHVLDATIGRPAALIVASMVMLAGILLTFNITLNELVPGMFNWLRSMWAMAWGGERRSPRQITKQPPDEHAIPMPPASTESGDMVLTPIAERPTRASLFRRPESDTASTSDKPTPSSDKPVTKPQPVSGLTETNKQTTEPTEKPPADANDQPTVQETLDGFEVPAIHLAWPLPSLELLDKPVVGVTSDHEHLSRLARLIEETLGSFKVEAQVVDVNTGPVITQFEVQPGVGVKVSKITTLEKDLALALAAPSIRIEAPIPGKSVVGIEIPNSAISVVTLYEVMSSDQYMAHRGKLKLPLGKDVSGVSAVADMTRMPHLLVAGSTGSGKSVAINAFLCGLLLKHTPDELRMIMVDPKMVELIVYNRVPHLLSPVVTELERVVPTLKWATREMERRYKIFARYGCRNLESYQKRAATRSDLEPMPYILIVIDELADLMMMAPDEVETQICRLAQMARATGIHLIIATQRPSVDVITGLIKANFPSRIAFAVTSQIDSRVILDTPGAERLLGRGDMLYMASDSSKLVRMQGTFVSDSEVEQIVTFWRDATPPEHRSKEQAESQGATSKGALSGASAAASPESTSPSPSSQPGQPSSSPPPLPSSKDTAHATDTTYTPPEAFLSDQEQETLLPQAMELVKQHKRASASLLQRRLRIGYSKAAQLIDLLEQQGVVGPADEGRSREVL